MVEWMKGYNDPIHAKKAQMGLGVCSLMFSVSYMAFHGYYYFSNPDINNCCSINV